MAKINIKIEGIPFEVEAGLTILDHFGRGKKLWL